MFFKFLMMSFCRLCLSSMTPNISYSFCNDSFEYQAKCAFKKNIEWQPFLFSTNTHYVKYENIIKKYSDWHSKMLYSEVPCKNKKVVIFEPNAGFGDSVGALSVAFKRSVQTGRFVNYFLIFFLIYIKLFSY